MRAPVKKRGGQYCRVIFPSEKTLDQVAYMKITMAIDMNLPMAKINKGSMVPALAWVYKIF